MLFVNGFSGLTKLALPVVTIIESICAPMIVYLALFHSKKMRRYRFFIINNVVWSCLFNWAVWFAKPAFMFPAACVVFENRLLHRVPVAKIAGSLMVILFVNVELAVVWVLFYRYFMAYPGKASDFVEKGKGFIISIVITQFVAYVLFFIPFYIHPIRSSPDQSIEKIRLLDQLPHFEEIEPEVGYICAPNLLLVSRYCLFAAVMLIICFLVGMAMFSIMGHRVMVVLPRMNMMKSTQQMHAMLFKARLCFNIALAVSVQIWVGYVFLLFPSAILFLAISYRWNEGTTVAAFCIMMVQTHGCVDFITMIYFIVPYRRKLLQVLGQNFPSKQVVRASSTVLRRALPDEPED
ncbi:unnamed protein product [Bursaphelenchus xylophilus]|uniref:(pine wood nematode) hypothetical protein n=1 Tax=Bursaphelenchus xylophilus TaxID=6326 RepID=A0A1I7RUN9_BURXY|nr:unnamed protein product [Bursaphelenchus xylophilus]CAG9114275.1 unnamed protein product [Bursaphelenchus xylophilus]